MRQLTYAIAVAEKGFVTVGEAQTHRIAEDVRNRSSDIDSAR